MHTQDTLYLFNFAPKNDQVNFVNKVMKQSDFSFQILCTLSDHDLNICKVSKELTYNCRRICIRKIPCIYAHWLEKCEKSDKNNLRIISK